MSSITEQFSAATKSQLETQFNVVTAIASTAVDSAEKFINLHLNAGKATLEKGAATARQLLDAKDPKELFSLVQPPSFDKLSAYGKELFDIATQAQHELIKAATQFKDAATAAAPAPLLAAVKSPAPAAAAPAVAVEVVAEAEPAPAAKPAAKLKPAVEAVAEVEQATPVSAVPPQPLAAPIEEPAPVVVKSVAPGKAKPAVKAPPKK
ncbi:phasin family protein [Oxalobacteraceae bacterium A2-2]